MQQRPNVVGLKLCQQAIVQKDTHNVTLVNCFRKLSFARFPGQARPFAICVVLTDGLGTGKAELTITSLVDLEEVWSRSWNIRFPDPLAERWFVVPVNACEFTHPGRYQVGLTIDGEPIARSVFRILSE
jgi:Family of unknown function (DUF6941)